jgi:hypothetical protein
MLKENAAILEFYRRQAAETEQGLSPSKPAVAAHDVDPAVQLKAPAGISGAHGISGKYYVVGADGGVAVDAGDADGLIAGGFIALAKDQNEIGSAS